jgi:phytoene synthase
MTLAWWRQELAAAFHGTPQHPVARALAEVAPRFNLAEARLNEIIDGMQMDLEFNRYPSFEVLRQYCHRVAGVVGLLSAEIFGYQDRRTLEYAADLGMAFQLTNIIRDVGEDARRNRIYLPLDEIERHGVSELDIAQLRETANFRRLIEFQIERALGYYREAFAKLPAADRRAQRAGIVMAAIYRAVLDEIRRDGCRVLSRRLSLTPIRKLWIAWWTWVRG